MLEYIISLSVLIAFVLIIRAIFRKKVSPRLMYALWLAVVIRMVVPISLFEFEVPLPDFFKTEQVVKTEDTLSDSEITHNHENYYPIDPPLGQIYPIDTPTAVDKPNTNYNPNEDIISVTPPINMPDDIVTDDEIVDPIIDEPQQNIIDVKRICDIVWLSGALICGGWILTASIIFNTRLYRDRTPHRIVRGTRVYVSPSVGVPCVAGFVPAIYLTPDCANSKSETLTIIHEKIHLRHGDHIWGIVRALAIIVFWYNPLVWIAASKSKQDAELACDDAISSKIDSDVRLQYANILLNFAPQKRRYALELSGAPLKERILMLTTKHKYRLVSAVLALLLAVTAVGCAFVSIGEKEDETGLEFEEQSVEDENNDELNDIGHGPFIGYVADKETPWIDLYTEKNGAYVGRIPYKIFHDWIATDRNGEGWTPGWESDYIHYYYAEFGDFRWAAVHLTSTVMGSGRKNIATSTDGGKTWSFGSTMDDYGGNHVTGIGFESAKVAVMCFDSMYEHDIFTEEGMVLPIVLSRTEDSGKTWTRTEIAVPSYLENYRTRPSVPKFDGAVGRISIDVYDADYKVVDTVYLVSLDAGLTWEWEGKQFDPDEFASYIPNESAKFEFWHKIFASETYLYFCSVREYNSYGASYTDAPPRDFAVYYVDASDPTTIGRIDAKLPEELEYDSVMPVFAGVGGGSGECMFILRLTNKGETSYVQFNNFSYTDYTNFLEFEYGGAVSDELLEHLAKENPDKFPEYK